MLFCEYDNEQSCSLKKWIHKLAYYLSAFRHEPSPLSQFIDY
jgi:hypothetical protein